MRWSCTDLPGFSVENLQADVVTFRLFQDQLLLRRLNGQLEMRWSCTDLPGFSVEPTTPKSRRSPEATRIFQAYFSALHCDAFPLSRPDHTAFLNNFEYPLRLEHL